ncbi:MAG: FecR domain-containing protein [Terriglobales bacterium]
MSNKLKPGVYVAWKQVTYRSVIMAILGALLIFFAAMHEVFPKFTDSTVKAAANLSSGLLEKVAGLAPPIKGPSAAVSQQAHFTALDGTIRVRKGNGNSWINADYNVPLEKGDVVQTGAEGMAKIVFNDGTNYTVKQDSLIVIEENSANDQQQTNVSVAVTTGTVDLTTATDVQGSKSQVIVAGAKASLAPDSAAMVHNDPKDDQHEILVKKGSSQIERNGEVVHLADWEKVNFQSTSKAMERSTEIGPPAPITPGNMMPVFMNTGEKAREVEFAWTPMGNAAGYRLRISHNPYFSSLLLDRKVATASVVVTGLPVGAYYWSIQSYDAAGKESVESEKNRFTIIVKAKEKIDLALELDPLIQHGHVIEVTGKTEAGARVMVNGKEVPIVGDDGSFHYFTPPLPNGENLVTVTAQNAKGGVNTHQEKVVIQ